MTAHHHDPAPDDETVLRALGEAFDESLDEPPAELVADAFSAIRIRPSDLPRDQPDAPDIAD